MLPITHFSSFRMWLSILFFLPAPPKPLCQGRVVGFVGGGGNIAITILPYLHHFMNCIVNINSL